MTARSVSVKLDADKGSREKATTGLGNALKTDRTRIASDKLVAADSVKLDGTKGSREKTTTGSGTALKTDRTRLSSDKLITANSEPARVKASDKVVERIGGDRSARSKTERSVTTKLSSGDSASRQRADRDGLQKTSPQRTVSGSGEGARTNTLISKDPVSARQPRTEGSVTRDGGREPRIVVNNNNNVTVEGNVSNRSVRPRVPRQLSRDISSLDHDSHWKRHDYYDGGHRDHHDSHSRFYFSFAWSNFSCGRVAYFPYSYYHSWCGYPTGYYGLSYYYPGYHRRFIFVSLGGYWPSWYRYHRYYWYGCHPYYWYGPDIVYYPPTVYYPSDGVTYNTYNYYTNEAPAAQPASTPYYDLGNPKPTEPEQPVDEPEYQTAADLCFEHAVELFAAGNYADAIAQFREAVTLSPEDVILPFTYAQALFANGDYALAASVLRSAIAQIPDDELTIYYPRGLYQDETVLNDQVAKLEAAAASEPFNADHQLLLGYQYMGLGDLNKARGPLAEAAKNPANEVTVGKLMELAAKLEQQKDEQ